MKVFSKLITAFLTLLVVATISAAVILKHLVDPNDYKQQITAYVEQQTGHKLHINGTIKFTFIPWIGISTNDITLDSGDNFEQAHLLSVHQAAIKIRLLPLLIGKVKIKNITLIQPAIHLVTNQQGQHNWTINTQQTPQTKSKSSASNNMAANTTDHIEKTNTNNIHIGDIIIEHGTIDILNQQSNQKMYISDAFLAYHNINMHGEPMPITTEFQFGQTNPATQLRLTLTGNLSYNQSTKQTTIKQMYLGGEISSYKEKLSKPVTFSTTLKKFTVDPTHFSLSKLSAKLGNAEVNADLNADFNKTLTQLSGHIVAPSFNPQQFNAALQLHNPALATLKQASLDLQVSSDKQGIHINPLSVQLNKSKINATADYQPSPINQLKFKINADQLNFDPFLNIPSQQQNTAMQASNTAAAKDNSSVNPADISPKMYWYNTSWQGSLSIGNLTLNRMHFNNLAVSTSNTNGNIQLSPISATFYKGQLNGKGSANISQGTASYAFQGAAKNIQLGPLLKDLTGKRPLEGEANLSAQLSTQGTQHAALIRQLNGTGQFTVAKGKLYGFNLDSLVNQVARFVGQGKIKKPTLKTGKQTNFNRLTASFNIKQGVVSNNDLLLQAQQAMATGSGQINLVNHTINYALNVGPTASSPQKQPWQFPLLVTGPLNKPKITPNVAVIIGEVIKSAISDGGKDAGKKIHQFIKGLFN